MANKWLYRRDSAFPFQTWKPFNKEAYVEVSCGTSPHAESQFGYMHEFNWAYESGNEGVIRKARLATPEDALAAKAGTSALFTARKAAEVSTSKPPAVHGMIGKILLHVEKAAIAGEKEVTYNFSASDDTTTRSYENLFELRRQLGLLGYVTELFTSDRFSDTSIKMQWRP